ncbi:hypothetical protein PG996_005976 [Apiospora saccharicola]|uniref:Uncharacterized protein n=1 Tax=Apiospora saccharicola TaxID=335842 RepID=A0ABR1VMY8_9PEZI
MAQRDWDYEAAFESRLALSRGTAISTGGSGDKAIPVCTTPENKFAPTIRTEEHSTKLLPLIDLITVDTLSAAGPLFNSFLWKLPYFVEKAAEIAAFDNLQDTTVNLIGQSTTIAKNMLSTDSSDWTAEKQDSFTTSRAGAT